MKRIVLTFTFLICEISNAGFEVNNGGSGIVCFKNQQVKERAEFLLKLNENRTVPVSVFAMKDIRDDVSSIQVLDLFEYQNGNSYWGYTPAQPEMSSYGNFQKQLDQWMAWIKLKSDFDLSLERSAKEFGFSQWVPASSLKRVNDLGRFYFSHLLLSSYGFDAEIKFPVPPKCLPIQLAMRRFGIIYFEDQLWKLMDETNRAALVFHEIVYDLAIRAKQTDSFETRTVVGTFLSMEFKEFSLYGKKGRYFQERRDVDRLLSRVLY